jgi:hypothetical protein
VPIPIVRWLFSYALLLLSLVLAAASFLRLGIALSATAPVASFPTETQAQLLRRPGGIFDRIESQVAGFPRHRQVSWR